jgi:HlyD family secretion protein
VNVTATIVASSRTDALTIPREAVRQDASHNYLYVVRDSHLERREIKLGISNLTRVEILSGLNEGDTVAVQSVSPTPMSDGIMVKIVESPQ